MKITASEVFEGPTIEAFPQAVSDKSIVNQAAIDACSAISVKNSADINATFSSYSNFITWYNDTLSEKPAFAHRGEISPDMMVANRFNTFWDQIPVVFGSTSATMIEFAALMSIGIQENSGDLWSNPEGAGKHAGYPGLKYFFSKIAGLKSSYNVNDDLENLTALRLFRTPYYADVHKGLSGYQKVMNDSGIDPAWGTETWPKQADTREDETINGFVMQADFYKFRGRGVIQTSGRGDYKVIIKFIRQNAARLNRPTLLSLKSTWEAYPVGHGEELDEVIASCSTNAQWETAFAEPAILAAGVSEDSRLKGNYLKLSRSEATLNAGMTTPGSLFFMAKKINGGNYPYEVVPMMVAMMKAIADLGGHS